MKVLVPMQVEHCQADCPFSHTQWTGESFRIYCTHGVLMKEIPSDDIPDWCPLRKYQEKK